MLLELCESFEAPHVLHMPQCCARVFGRGTPTMLFLFSLLTTIALGQQLACRGSSTSLYDFNATLVSGENVSLSSYRGYVCSALCSRSCLIG